MSAAVRRGPCDNCGKPCEPDEIFCPACKPAPRAPNSYEARQERRRERLLSLADRLEREGSARHERARALASVIPFGQPILVGHHSEGRDRRYRDKIHRTFTAAFAAQQAAKETRQRAAAVGTGGISSDDPDAVAKLRGELARVEATARFMAAANKVVRAFYKAGVRDASSEGWSRYLDKLHEVELGRSLSEHQARELLNPRYSYERPGFQGWQLSNNSANLRRIKGRIEQLSARADAAEREDAEIVTEAYRVVLSYSDNRLRLIFPGKPSEKVRSTLKANGFKWSPTAGAWQRMLSGYFHGHALPGGYLHNSILEAQQSGPCPYHARDVGAAS